MRILIALFILLNTGCTKAQSIKIGPGRLGNYTPVSPLIIIAGESNAGGLASNSDLTTYELAPRTAVKILNNYNFQFESLDVGTNNVMLHASFTDNASHGIENGLANCVDSGFFGAVPIYILKAGQGGSRIDNWNNAVSHSYYDTLIKRVDTAIKLMTVINRGYPPPIYIFWSQGINDGNASYDPSTWKDSTKSFFVKIRARYGANIPIVMTRFDFTSYTTYSTKISEIAAELPNTFAINTTGLTRIDSYHWNSTSMKSIASAFTHYIIENYRYK